MLNIMLIIIMVVNYKKTKKYMTKIITNRIVIVDAEYGVPPDDYNKEYEDEE